MVFRYKESHIFKMYSAVFENWETIFTLHIFKAESRCNAAFEGSLHILGHINIRWWVNHYVYVKFLGLSNSLKLKLFYVKAALYDIATCDLLILEVIYPDKLFYE